jgi:hypothetical protein
MSDDGASLSLKPSVPNLVDPANDGDTTVIASSGTGFPLEAWQASSSAVDAQPAISLWVDVRHRRLPTSHFGYGSDEGCVASSDNGRSHDPANDVGLALSLDDEEFIHPCCTSPKHSSSTISNKGLSSKPLYFPEWFDNAIPSKRKWSDSVEHKDDLGDIPESWMNSSHQDQTEPLSPILPDLISLSDVIEEMGNTSRGKVAKRVLTGCLKYFMPLPTLSQASCSQLIVSKKVQSLRRSQGRLTRHQQMFTTRFMQT